MIGDVIRPTWDLRQPIAVQMHDQTPPDGWLDTGECHAPRGFHLGQLHHVLQAAFGWLDYHLHEFEPVDSYGDREQIKPPEFVGDRHGLNESMVQLLDFSRAGQIVFVYVYDFGDHWMHRVKFERPLVLEPDRACQVQYWGCRCLT